MTLYKKDKERNPHPPIFQRFWRGAQESNLMPIRFLYKILNRFFQFIYKCEIPNEAKIGPGLYIGHPYGITINPKSTIGRNCNIHKGVTIGQENRGARKGTPNIGNEVWIGINSTIVGKITIGNDVLIAPNSFVNRDIPSHSIVFGNPCSIKHVYGATDGYINNKSQSN